MLALEHRQKMIKCYAEIFKAFGYELKDLQLGIHASDGNLVECKAVGYLNEEQLLASMQVISFMSKAYENEQCKDLIEQIEMILTLTDER